MIGAEPLAVAIRGTPEFRGKHRLVTWWQRRQTQMLRPRRTGWGYKLLLDTSEPYEAMIWLDREERVELDALGRLLGPGDCFIDVGANIGLWALRAGMLVGPTGHVWAVEPNPTVYERLVKHVRLNELGAVIVPVECAAGDFESHGILEAGSSHNLATVRTPAGLGAADEDALLLVPVRQLDEIVGASLHITGMKIDVEGGELAVLEGAQRLLGSSRPWICVEFNTTLLPSRRLGDWSVHQFLVDHQYVECPKIFGDPAHPRVDDSWSPTGYHNLLYVPSERHA